MKEEMKGGKVEGRGTQILRSEVREEAAFVLI